MKKLKFLIVFVLIGSLIWYLFFKPYDYLVTLKARTFPGAINQTIKTWSKNLDGSTIINQENINYLKQQITFNDSTYLYTWNITAINDSTSKVKVYIKDIDHSFNNKIAIPFSNTDLEKRTKRTLLDFYKKLNEHIKKFKVKIVGKSKLKSTYCAYVPIKGTQFGKAMGMMQNYSILTSFIDKNDIKLNGEPMIEITYWDINKDSIQYNFCFPIIKNDSLPTHRFIKYKQLESKEAIKAIYNGNYITSDRAWYALIDYAKNNNIEIENKPIEIFYNNPNMGGNALKWTAEIYLPIK